MKTDLTPRVLLSFDIIPKLKCSALVKCALVKGLCLDTALIPSHGKDEWQVK